MQVDELQNTYKQEMWAKGLKGSVVTESKFKTCFPLAEADVFHAIDITETIVL